MIVDDTRAGRCSDRNGAARSPTSRHCSSLRPVPILVTVLNSSASCVVDADQQGADPEPDPLAAAEEVAEHDTVDRVFERPARVPLQLDPVEVARARLIRRVDAFDDQALQAALERVLEELIQPLRVVDDHARSGCRTSVPRTVVIRRLDALVERSIEQRLAVAVHDVEDHGLDRQLGLQLADAVLAAPARRLLEGQKFFGQRD